ncbi:MAG: hypothetical protein Q8J88_11380 [Bacteroidales bacterium]|nr:hypothetical protein [Bacteroidales bacterium]
MQLIVFFNLVSFKTLLNLNGLNDDFKNLFSHYVIDEDGNRDLVYFNSNIPNGIIYIDENGGFEAGSFDQNKASNASILMMPDNTDISYLPEDIFIIIKHSAPVAMLNYLTNNPFYITMKEDNEERKTQLTGQYSLYYKLVLFIGNDKKLTFNQFLKENNLHGNTRLEKALDFLHECLISKPKVVPAELSNSKTNSLLIALPSNLQDKGYIEALAELRDAILESAE